MSSEPVVPPNLTEDVGETDSAAPTVPFPSKPTNVRELPIASDVVAPAQPDFVRREPAPRVRDAAETVGAAVGKAVGKVRELPRRVSEMKERLTVVGGRKREDTATKAAEVKETARVRLHEAQSRADQIAHEYPIQFILGMGAAAFMLGFVMRIWRSSRRAW